MTEKTAKTSSLLPALTPDLVVSATGAPHHWRVESVSERFAQLLGCSADKIRGRLLPGLFAEAVPALQDLAQEVATNNEPITGLRVRLKEGTTPFQVDVRPGGLREDFQGPVILFSFLEMPEKVASPSQPFFGIVGDSPAIREVFRKIRLYAASDASVVITGETGTGKELVAQALHQCSARQQEPFVALNCSAISEELLESELFGHEKGAFTGAIRTHRGRFERADGGSLFLDEIGDMPLHTQTKLLRVLEAGTIERVGSEVEKQVDVRIISATNVPLEQAVSRNRFRADLYHRLSVLRIHIPPLRDRLEDIPLLVDHLLANFSRKYGRVVKRLTPEAMALLQSYLWPGNVRELRNAMERVFVENQAEVIGARAFREWIQERQEFARWEEAQHPRSSNPMIPPYPLASSQPLLAHSPHDVMEAEIVPPAWAGGGKSAAMPSREQIIHAYQRANGNLAGAARLLGIHRATLYRYLDKLNLSREDLEDA